LEGFNCTIFAYGQTGTGKTYTMEGGDRNSADGRDLSEVAGVIPRAISQIFQHLDSINSEYTVKCSFLELYNEETTDLLAVGESKSNQKLRMLEDKSGVNVQGLEEIIVKSSADIYTLLDRGSAKRRTAETLLNKQSSRSHSVFCITVHMRETPTEGEDVIKVGKLYLVDLAGSENVGRLVHSKIHAPCMQALGIFYTFLCFAFSSLSCSCTSDTHRDMAVALNAMHADCSDGLHQVQFCNLIPSHILQNCFMSYRDLLTVLLCV